jgi:GNAT superfamily N-acetyltransferase
MAANHGLEPVIQAYLRASISDGREIERIGPFLASFTRSSRNPFLNYAIPDDAAQPSGAEVAALIAAYERRGLRPRLEYLTSCAPLTEPVLLSGGFAVEGRLALMVAGDVAAIDAPAPSDIELLRPTTDEELRGLRLVQQEAYDDPEPVDQAQIDRLAANLAAGAGAVLARVTDGGEPCGAGEWTPAIDGVAEIVGIAVRVPFRRRGIAAAVTARLLRDARASGVTVPFLMANEAEERIYARVGFTTISRVLHISREMTVSDGGTVA